jgi:O-antigen/teichoic acid export membrane protein
MANKEQQVKNSFIYMLPLLVSGIFPFVALPILTRILTKEDYGILALSQIYAILVAGFANFGMSASYDRNFFKYRSDKIKSAQLLFSTLFFVILNFVFLASLTFFFRNTFAKLIIRDAQYGNLLFAALCAQFSSTVSYYYYSYFKNSELAKKFTAYTISQNIINVVLSLFMVAYLKTGVIGILYAQLLSGAIIFCVLSYKFLKTLKPSLDKSILLESIKISYPLTPTIFFGVIGTQFDKYMIGMLASLGGVGIYSIGQKVASVSFTFMTAIQNVFSPQVYTRMFNLKEKGGESAGRYLTPFVYISTAFALIIAVFSEEIISILTPVSYHGAIDIVTVLAMYYGFLFFGKISPMQLIYTKKTHLCTVLSTVSIGFNIALNIIFIMKWGAIGAAWGTFLAAVISGSIYFIVAQRHYLIKWEYLKVSTIILTFFVSAVLIVVMRNASVDYAMRLIVKGAAISLYVYLGIKFNVITTDNFNLIKNTFNLRNQLIKVTHR